ncbi:MAG: GNAT family N-acetyltransferase [Mycobacterium sp.]
MTAAIRRALASDAPAITDLTLLAYAKWVPLIGREPLPMTVDYSVAVIAHRIDLLHDATTLAGLIETVDEGDCLLIENVAVHPDFQGRGYGRHLLTHAETLAAQAGIGRMRLYTNSKFLTNITLYRSLGYTVDREEPFHGGAITHMSKPL